VRAVPLRGVSNEKRAAQNRALVAFTAAKLATVPLNPARGWARDGNDVAAPSGAQVRAIASAPGTR